MGPMHFVGISGSLRAASYNTTLLCAAFDDLPEGVTAEIASLDGISFHNQDFEKTVGMPESVEVRHRGCVR
jgi:chromate reductase, NAD(P)H dehydrogenase (quinone)